MKKSIKKTKLPAAFFDLLYILTLNKQTAKTGHKVEKIDLHHKLKAQLNNQLKQLKQLKKPYLPIKGTGDILHIGFDCEWVYHVDSKGNHVLSYQATVITKDFIFSVIYYTSSSSKKQRLSLQKFVSMVIQDALDEKVITKWPCKVFLYAHFLRADLPCFNDFFKFKKKLSGVGKTVTSIGRDLYAFDYPAYAGKKMNKDDILIRGKHGKNYSIPVKFIDTLLLTPNGMGLDAVGELIGLPKLDIPEPYDKSRMDLYLENDKEGFEAYAIRDAEIAVLYGLKATVFVKEDLQLKGMPPSIAGLAVNYFTRETPDDALQSIYGMHTVSNTGWNSNKNSVVTWKKNCPTPARLLFEAHFIESYYGGRNECFMVGPTDIGVWNDFDLAGAYTTGLLDIDLLDYNRAYLSDNIDDYCGHVCGSAWIKFSCPADIKYPPFPVKNGADSLFFPQEGHCYATAPEMYLAHLMGCDIEIQRGVIVPWIADSHSLFENFVRTVRNKRADYEKGSFQELMWKEIGNSLYGKHGQGLRAKNAFDTKTGVSKEIPYSKLSNPYMASHVTGFIRAVICELLNSIPSHRSIVSVTTDGFLTDANLDEIDMSGPLCTRFQAHCNLLEHPKEMH